MKRFNTRVETFLGDLCSGQIDKVYSHLGSAQRKDLRIRSVIAAIITAMKDLTMVSAKWQPQRQGPNTYTTAIILSELRSPKKILFSVTWEHTGGKCVVTAISPQGNN